MPMPRTTKWAAMLATMLCSLPVHAAGDGQGLIQPHWNLYDGILFFHLSGPHNNSPCSIGQRWAINTLTPSGKSAYTAFLLAYSMGKTVLAVGNSNCLHGNTEEVLDFHVVD